MAGWAWLLVAAGAVFAVWAAAMVALVRAGRGDDARALARFVPDCARLFRRLLGDARLPRSRKLAVAALLGYLAMPFDLVPDFIPVVGALDDAVLVALVVRSVIRAAGPQVVAEHWPGPASSLDVLMRAAGAPPRRR